MASLIALAAAACLVWVGAKRRRVAHARLASLPPDSWRVTQAATLLRHSPVKRSHCRFWRLFGLSGPACCCCASSTRMSDAHQLVLASVRRAPGSVRRRIRRPRARTLPPAILGHRRSKEMPIGRGAAAMTVGVRFGRSVLDARWSAAAGVRADPRMLRVGVLVGSSRSASAHAYDPRPNRPLRRSRGAARLPGREPQSGVGQLNWKVAWWAVPSASLRTSCRHVPSQDRAVFQV